MTLFGGIEAGGTKFICAVGTGPDDLRGLTRIPTGAPERTMDRAVAALSEAAGGETIDAVGIASFGPLDPARSSPTFGHITTTPKPGWQGVDLAGRVGRALGCPVAFDTDVNGAILAEHRWGAARGLACAVYLTVGTGIGGGGIVEGHLLHGLMHPEMGHVVVSRRPDDPFEGICPYHRDCLEGLASGRALEKRCGRAPENLPADHPAWQTEATYLAAGLASIIYTLSPQRIILGGGLMQQPALLEHVRARLREQIAGYLASPLLEERISDYLVPPALGPRAGVLGAIALAGEASGAAGPPFAS